MVWDMAQNKLLYDVHDGVARAVLIKNGQIADCAFDVAARPAETGAIYAGIVDRVMPHERGAFIKIKDNENGFVNDAEGLNAGQRVLVQVKAEAREDKGMLLTRSISLPGVYFILQPFGDGVHVSRRLDDAGADAAVNAAQKLLMGKPGGWVIRSAALHGTREEMAAEIEELCAAARKIMGAGEGQGLCLAAPSVFEQTVLAAAGEGNLSISLEKGVDLENVTAYLRAVRPTLLASMHISTREHAFDEADAEGFYQSLTQKSVALKQGGTVIFERTNTMHVIDVNAGTRTHFMDVNRDAAICIMQQLRWRNIGGLIVIDFLKMRKPDDRHRIADTLRDLSETDHAPMDVYGFTRMGLCEISRARRGFSLDEVLEKAKGKT